MDRRCDDCGVDLSSAHHRRKRCEECSPSVVPGKTRSCDEPGCGKDISGKRGRGSVCDDHAAERKRRRHRAQKKIARDRESVQRRASRRCVDCDGPNPTRYHKCQPCRDGERECIVGDCTEITDPGLSRCDEHASDNEKFSAYMRNWQKANPVKVQLWHRRRWARRHGVAFELTVADVEEIYPERCPVCSVLLTRDRDQAATNGSIDRIDNDHAVGYIKGNVTVVCVGCNGRKRDLTVPELATGEAGPEWQAWAVAHLAGRKSRRVVRRRRP